jgi:hypothetical protein
MLKPCARTISKDARKQSVSVHAKFPETQTKWCVALEAQFPGMQVKNGVPENFQGRGKIVQPSGSKISRDEPNKETVSAHIFSKDAKKHGVHEHPQFAV